jgi:hypothetical protein
VVFQTDNHLVTGLSVVVLAGSGAVAQLIFGRSSPWLGTAAGSVALAAGLLVIVLSATAESGALLLGGAVLGGAGFGVAFLGSLRALSVAIPNEHRAQVMSAFYVVAYSSLSPPVSRSARGGIRPSAGVPVRAGDGVAVSSLTGGKWAAAGGPPVAGSHNSAAYGRPRTHRIPVHCARPRHTGSRWLRLTS